MNSRAGVILTILAAGITLIAIWRFYRIYRRRRRWKLLTTSDHSLHIARERIIARPELPEEE